MAARGVTHPLPNQLHPSSDTHTHSQYPKRQHPTRKAPFAVCVSVYISSLETKSTFNNVSVLTSVLYSRYDLFGNRGRCLQLYKMSSVNKREREQRRKLQHFLSDLALLGSLQGFKYFQPWLRGKEELLLTVVNEDLGWRSPGFAVSRASSYSSTSSCNSSDVSPSSSSPSLASRSSSPLPGEPPCPRASQSHTLTKTQPHTARDPSSEEHLLPASPSEREIAVPEVNCTLFLLAGYVKYGRPHAWIRSNHERLVNIGGTDSMVKDTPMKLKSISDWQTRGIRVWDVISELVCLCTVPSPSNPFALDMRYIKSLPLPDRFLVTGALLNFLETYVVYGNRDELHYDKVVEEVKPLRRLHVQSLLELQRHRESPRLLGSPTEQDSSGEE